MKVILPTWPDLANGRLADISDCDLISEMIRRKRLHRVEASLPFYGELRDEPGYMDYNKRTAFASLSRAFLEDPELSQMVFKEHPAVPPNRLLTAGVTILLTTEKDDAVTGEGKA